MQLDTKVANAPKLLIFCNILFLDPLAQTKHEICQKLDFWRKKNIQKNCHACFIHFCNHISSSG